jgi:hypothetical protein
MKTQPISAALAIALLTSIVGPNARADESRPATSASDSVSSPCSFPDSDHVANGCHVSTLRFLARFLAEFPSETGSPLVIRMRNGDGVSRSHTVAIVSWHGEWWCRDEYFGVFALGCTVKAPLEQRRLVSRTESRLEARARMTVRMSPAAARPAPPTQLSAEQRLRDVTVAARMIPFATKVYWVRGGGRELPVVFFRPGDRQIAVYDPLHGTCIAECSAGDDAKVVGLVAAQLGYPVDAVRPDLAPPQGALLASLNTPHAGLLQ